VVNGLAIILSMYIMAPVAEDTFALLDKSGISKVTFAQMNVQTIRTTYESSKVPLQQFLLKHSNPRERAFFVEATKKLWKDRSSDRVQPDDMMVLIPAFTVSELTAAFQIGFLIYLPFIAIDLIVSNILLAMGMMMVSPVTISLPFKLLLFVLVNGWARLIHGLVLTYV